MEDGLEMDFPWLNNNKQQQKNLNSIWFSLLVALSTMKL